MRDADQASRRSRIQFQAIALGRTAGDLGVLRPLPGRASPVSFCQSLHALLWEAGRVVDLGNLGGKGSLNGHFAHVINNLDEVVGATDLKGDTSTHAFRWTKIGGMQDLGWEAAAVDHHFVSDDDLTALVGELDHVTFVKPKPAPLDGLGW